MKAALSVAAIAVAEAAWAPEGSNGTQRLNPVLAAGQTTRCYRPWGTGFMGIKAYDPTCNATSPNNATPHPGPDCIFTGSGTLTNGAQFFNFGPTVAADPACCLALVDMSIIVMEQAGGWNVHACQPDECGTVGTNATQNFWSTGAPFAPGAAPITRANLPSEAQFIASSQKVFGNNAKCWTDAKTYMSTNLLTDAAAPAAVKGILAGVAFPYMDKRMHGDMAPRTNLVQITNKDNFCYFANRTHDPSCGSDATIKVPVPGCVHVHSVTRALYFDFGDKAASQPGCCNALRTLTLIANRWQTPGWVNTGCDFYVNGAPSCMAAGNSTEEFWAHPAMRSGNLTNPEDMYGLFPSEAAYTEAIDTLVATHNGRDAACYENAFDFASATPSFALNSILPGMMPGMKGMAGSKFPTTVAPTTTPAPTTAPPASSGSEQSGSQSGAQSGSAPVATAVAAKVVSSSFVATEVLPDNVTPAQLLASTTYKTAKQTGIGQGSGESVITAAPTVSSVAAPAAPSTANSLSPTPKKTSGAATVGFAGLAAMALLF